MKIRKITLILLAMLLLICSLSTISAANNTISDTDTGGILQGITDTGNGETLFLNPGTYNKTNQDTNIIINKNITIQGNGAKDTVIIDAQGLSRIFTIYPNLNVTFINMTFINAYGYRNGGAITAGYGNTTLNFVDCVFINNSIDRDNSTSQTNGIGGAIYFINSNATIINCDFINNIANILNECSGGAIYAHSSNLTIIGSNFINNNAFSGGAIASYATNLNISNTNFIDNNAAGMNGGAINTNRGTLNITNSSFINNSAINEGSAIFSYLTDIFINNNSFMNNTAGNGSVIDRVNGSLITQNNFDYIQSDLGINTTVSSNKIKIIVTSTDINGNVIVGRTINFYINGELVGSVETNSEGIAEFIYIATESGTYNILATTDNFLVPDAILTKVYLEANISENVTVIINEKIIPDPTPNPTPKKPKNPDDPNPKNDTKKTNNNPTATAAMKETGIPIQLIILILLSCLGIVIRKK